MSINNTKQLGLIIADRHQWNRGLSMFMGLWLIVWQVAAHNVQSLKTQGLIGEMANGYLGWVHEPASDELKAYVAAVNQKRLLMYKQIAQLHQLPLQQVELVAGNWRMHQTRSNDYMNTGDHNWILK